MKEFDCNQFLVIQFILKQVRILQHIHIIQYFKVIGKNHQIIMLKELEIIIVRHTHILDQNGLKLLLKIMQPIKNLCINQEEVHMYDLELFH